MTQKQRSTVIYSVAGILLSIPFFAMQFTKEVDWTFSDFLIGGVLLFSLAFGIDFTLRKVKTLKNRILIALAIFIVFALIWAELAVGIFGTPFAGS